MKSIQSMYPRARIPYGVWGCSFFPAWQTSALAEVNIGQFAGEAMNRILGIRKMPAHLLDYLIVGSTIPWHWKFWNAPMIASFLGNRIPGYHIEQACATGLKAVLLAGNEIQSGSSDMVGVLTFDRTSDAPVGVFPERRAYRRTEAINDVWDQFGFDPAVGKSMIAAAGNAARKHKLDRHEVDEIAYCHYQHYFDSKASGFHEKYVFPFDILNTQGKLLGKIDGDTGIRQITLKGLHEMRELDACVTPGTQTHPSDGMATMLVTTEDKAREISPQPEIDIQFVAKEEVRVHQALMPEAPSCAVDQLIERTGINLDDIRVVKSHNPFSINDAIFCKRFGFDWRKMNRTGSSLVYGHPQGPTLTRILIEALEETVSLGGGYALILGCAAGDVGVAALFKVD